MLEVGKAGSAGVSKGVLPFLRDGAVVATVRASQWKEAATAVIGDREWVFSKTRGTLVGRWAAEPDGTSRLRSGSTGGWSPRPTLISDDSLPLHHQVFLLWLELVISRRDQAALAGATAAAVIGGSS